MTKNMLLFEENMVNEVVENVPHRHLVFCLPKAFRYGFTRNREKLNDLSRLAWETFKEFAQTTLNSNGVPGAAQIIQTHGNMLNINPHIHVIVTDGVFLKNGEFRQLPELDKRAAAYIQAIFEKKVMRFCLRNQMVKEDTVISMLNWRYTGFSVYTDSKMDLGVLADGLDLNDNAKVEEAQKIGQMLRYIAKPFFAQSKIIMEDGAERVLYKGDWHHPTKRNFEYFSFTDFIAAVSAHVPNHRQKYKNFYGWYSNKSRGLRKKAGIDHGQDVDIQPATKQQAAYSKNWAMLIKKVWEVDPLICSKCGSEMKVISVLNDLQVVRRILEHIGEWRGLPEWKPAKSRGSPAEPEMEDDDLTYEPFYDEWGDNRDSA